MNRTPIVVAAFVAFAGTLWLQLHDAMESAQGATAARPLQSIDRKTVFERAATVEVSVPGAQMNPRGQLAAPSSGGTIALGADIDPRVLTSDQNEIAEYASGISQIAPVSGDQRRALLEAKVRHRVAFDTALREAGVGRETLSLAEREYAHRTVARALSDYQEAFLLDAQPVLDPEQFQLLSNFETTEFSQHLARLQRQINAK